MTTIKRTVLVTIQKEIEVELTPSVFFGMSVEEYLSEFRKSLWDVDDIDDVVMYAARVAAFGGIGTEEDGLGLINEYGREYPKKGDVLIRILSDNCESEIIGV